MSCFHGYDFTDGHEDCFAVDASHLVFGPGVLRDLGAHLRSLGATRVALFTDPRVGALELTAAAVAGARAAGIDLAIYDRCRVEPTDASFVEAAEFARAGRFDGYVSIGGGSVIDTAKAAALHATFPADFLAYVNAPIGEGRAIPGPLPVHVACPTTCGTGSEHTGIAVFDLVARHVKTGIASRRLRPTLALVDPTATRSLPAAVVAASGFDVLCHALESFTARPFSARSRPSSPEQRPMSQGRNPWSDLGAREALRLGGRYLARAVNDASDHEARESLAWAATLAGIAFGNAGVHLPHAMAYAVAGLVRDYRAPGYPPGEAMVPHGFSVVTTAPSTFATTAATSPARHLEAAALLGAETRDAGADDAGAILTDALATLMRKTGAPNGLSGVGYGEADLAALTKGSIVQRRLVENAPLAIDEAAMERLLRGSIAYW